MTETELTLHEAVAVLKEELQLAKDKMADANKRHYNGLTEQVLIHCIKRATDIGEGCIVTADAGLPESLFSLARSIFEIFLQMYWLTSSAENAKAFVAAGENDLRRSIRSNLQKGYATVTSKATGEDKSQELK